MQNIILIQNLEVQHFLITWLWISFIITDTFMIMKIMMITLYCQIMSDIFLASQQLHLQHHRKDKN